MKSDEKGFTLIELVIVIIILGILAVVAIPKFINLQDDARKSAMAGQFAAFESAVSLYHSGWAAAGNSTAVEKLAGFGQGDVASSPTGFPYSTSGTSTHPFTACEELWHGITTTDFTIAAVTDSDLMTADVDIAYTYRADECIYRDLYFIQRGESTKVMEYNFKTGAIDIIDAFYNADGSLQP
ncbi:prepilin-type N-terminal cleavage/methylation domain-containing protein [Shewanella sp. 10N.261.52.F9]|uniref:prepilin-type N-terminal cleavage/methylation domain-containing protein n=1 Tax=Shewanella TaxID=22 RepID=UPI00201015E2|nr:prepilin-type N-terminal cleavage/methylation domain-containing protein [Shewanella marinintestina]MCL1148492.1 prepilin-type N-terminal cleavage/methylation domain-containing protein [Shewanella marinintestina]